MVEARLVEGDVEREHSQRPGGGRVGYAFEVLRRFKGETGSRIRVWTQGSGAMCGRSFAPGVSYPLYAKLDTEGRLRDSLCSRSREMSRASEDLEQLGKGAVVRAGGSSKEPSGTPRRAEIATEPAPTAAHCTVSEPAPAPPPSALIALGALAWRRRRAYVRP